ncbi:MAG: winged helix-turn-helix transcriptional regulator [Verrucomicrobiales bacterium]|nr:winged helix-turn-helix transcriptional regulator [Verrucomicrobiales bacterium]
MRQPAKQPASASDRASRPAGAVRRPAPRRYLPPLLRRAWYGLNQAFRRRIAHLGLTPDQYTVLRNLAETEPDGLTQKELCERMASDANTMAALIERMEAAGFLRRESDRTDRRAKRAQLEPLGADRLAAAAGFALDLHAAILSVLPAAERATFLRQLEAVAGACQNALADSPRASGTPPKKSGPGRHASLAGQQPAG